MLIVALGISIIVGVVVTLGLQQYENKKIQSAESVSTPLKLPVELVHHEVHLLQQLLSHQKQLLHIEEQCIRLRNKNPASELIGRYEEDAALLEVRAQEISEDLHHVWTTRMLKGFEQEYEKLLHTFPKLPSFEEQKSYEVYQQSILEITEYMRAIEQKKKDIDELIIKVPAFSFDSGNVQVFVEEARKHTSKQCVILFEKSDAICDQLQYLCDSLQNVQISGDAQWDQSGLTLQVQDLSSYLKQPASLFETLQFEDRMQEYSKGLRSKSSDIRSRFRAHREVEQNLRKNFKKD